MFPTLCKNFPSQAFVKLTSVERKRVGRGGVGGRGVFKTYQNTERLVTVSRLKKRLKYCRSRGMIRDHRGSIFAKHHYVNYWPFVLCTPLLTYVSYVVT